MHSYFAIRASKYPVESTEKGKKEKGMKKSSS